MKAFYPTYLYVKTHNKTGLKYFGKTTKSNPEKYIGSGKYWLDHIKVHGNDVSTEIIGYYTDKDECVAAALNFSITNNIVTAVNKDNKKIWANQINENGLDGGATRWGQHSDETKEKIRVANTGKVVPNDVREKIKTARAKQTNVRTKGSWSPSAEARQKIRSANLGKKQSEETRKKRSEKLKGHAVSESTRKKISAKHKGKKLGFEHIQKIKNRVVKEETKEKIREARKYQVITEQTKEKLKGKVVCVNKEGLLVRIDKDQYYSQPGPKENWEWVAHRSKEATMRRN